VVGLKVLKMTDSSSANVIQVGSYAQMRVAEPKDCKSCKNADFGDFLYNGVCGKCLERMAINYHAGLVKIANMSSEMPIENAIRIAYQYLDLGPKKME